MVIDTSAIVAILLGEPEALDFIEKIETDPIRLISAANALEGEKGKKELDNLLDEAEINIISIDKEHYKNAYEAWWKYGKSRHRASLNFGDCFAYARNSSLRG